LHPLRFVDPDGRPVLTGLPPAVTTTGGFGNGLIAWSHDGRQLAVVAQNSNLRAAIWIIEPDAPNAAFRRIVELFPGPRIRGMAWLPDDSGLIFGKHDTTSDIVLIDLAR
jgi:hypothetical protein